MQVRQCNAQQAPSSFAGGDWGTLISFLLGTRHSDHCKAIHTLARAFPKLHHPWHVAQLLNHRLPILNKVTDFKCNLGLIFLAIVGLAVQMDSLQHHLTSFKTHASRLMHCALLPHGSRLTQQHIASRSFPSFHLACCPHPPHFPHLPICPIFLLL